MILVAGKWFDWWGGLTWGYRSIIDAFVDRIVASRPLRVMCGALLAWSVAVQFVGAYSYSLMGWNDLWREYDRPEQASVWRRDRPPDRLPPRQLQLRAGQEKAGDGHLPEPPRPDPQPAHQGIQLNPRLGLDGR